MMPFRALLRGALPAAILLAGCATPQPLLLPSPPAVIHREPAAAPPASGTGTPRPETTPLPPPDHARLYGEAIAKTRQALSRGAAREALPAWEALEGGPWRADAVFNEGVLLQLAGDIDGAVARYRRITEIPPASERAAANLLGIYLIRGERENARRMIELNLPSNAEVPPKMLPELAANMGAALIEQGDLARAGEIFRQLREKGIRTPALQWNLAVLSYRNGDVAAARRFTAETPPAVAGLWPVVASRVAWEPDTAPVPGVDNLPLTGRTIGVMAKNLSAFRDYREGNFSAAEGKLASVADNDATGEILSNLGIALVAQGKWKEGKARLEQAVREHPEAPGGWLNLGIFREVHEGNAQAALECYKNYDKLGSLRKDEVRKWIDWLKSSAPPRP